LFIDSLNKKSSHVETALYIPVPFINKLFGSYKRGVKGCNFSLYKSALFEINGFDMRYELPCVGEDTDPEFRLKLLGYEVFLPKFRLIQFHLHHKKLSREGNTENIKILTETISNKTVKAPLGISQLGLLNQG
jgi:GT2 family glycosyltransferase